MALNQHRTQMAKIKINNFRRTVRKIAKDQLDKLGQEIASEMADQITETFRNSGQPGEPWMPLWADNVEGHYRSGGKPLSDTGELAASFQRPAVSIQGNVLTVTMLSSADYARWHQDGYSTDGPNYIPITYKGKTQHVAGADPKKEGLIQGVDYVMAWNGVDVPQRKMVDYQNRTNKNRILDVIKNFY